MVSLKVLNNFLEFASYSKIVENARKLKYQENFETRQFTAFSGINDNFMKFEIILSLISR